MKKAFALLGFLVACGDNTHASNPDAGEIDGGADAPLDAFVECNYTEQHDTTNDYFADPTAIEETGVHFTGGGPRTICGTINNGHYNADPAYQTVDIDNYGFTVDHDADVIVRLTGNAQNILQVGVFAVTDTRGFAGGDYYLGNHAVFSQSLKAGHYQISVEATDVQDATAPVDYKVRMSIDDPATRCADVTATADYTEAHDGLTNDGNDMVAIDYNQFPVYSFTGSPLDVPEPTNLVLDPAKDYRISGTSASVAGQGSYFDRDTYVITTGATTNEISVRMKPGASTADMDFYLFQENRDFGLSFNGAQMMGGAEEFATLAVNPNSRYWLWVGKANADSDNTSSTYDASICAAEFTGE